MLKMIPITNLYTSSNVRAQYDDEIKDLAQSIKDNGLLEPLVVQERDNGRYEVICGHRRLSALKLIGEPLVECNVILPSEHRTIIQLIENTQRREMLPWELTDAFDKIKAKHHLTNEQLAAKLGKTKSWIMNQYTKAHLVEKTFGNDGKYVSKRQVKDIYNTYIAESKKRSGNVTEYSNGLKVSRLMKTKSRAYYKYEINFLSEEFRAKLEKLIEQEAQK